MKTYIKSRVTTETQPEARFDGNKVVLSFHSGLGKNKISVDIPSKIELEELIYQLRTEALKWESQNSIPKASKRTERGSKIKPKSCPLQ